MEVSQAQLEFNLQSGMSKPQLEVFHLQLQVSHLPMKVSHLHSEVFHL